MKNYIASLFDRKPGNVPSFSSSHFKWFLDGLAFLTHKPPTTLQTNALTGLLEVQKGAKEYGVSFSETNIKDLFDEALHPPSAKFLLFVGNPEKEPTPALVLGKKDAYYLLASPDEPQPTQVTREALAQMVVGPLFELRFPVKLAQDRLESFGWSWFLKAFFTRKRVIRDILLAGLAIQIIALLFPLATQVIVDKVIQNQAVNTLVAVGVGIFLFALFSASLSWLRQKFMLRLANLVDSELALEVLTHLFKLPLRYFEDRATGVLINRIHGVERIREFFSSAFILIVLELPFMLIFFVLMLTYSPLLSSVVIGFVTIMVCVSFAIGPQLRKQINQQSQMGASVQGFLTEYVSASESVKTLQLEPHTLSRFQTMNREYLDATLHTKELSNSYSTFMNFMEQAMNASVLCIGAYISMGSPSLSQTLTSTSSGATTELTIGMLVAFQMFAQKVIQPLLKLSGTWQELQQVRVAVQLLGDVLNTPTERYSSIATAAPPSNGKLTIENLGFRHSPAHPLLYKDLSLSLEPGEVVLVTGASGSGKSTLAKILLGLYPDYEGRVKIDDRSLRAMTTNEIRNFFGVVPQDTILFSGTITENLLMASPFTNFEQVVEACKWAGVHEAISNLPNGYETTIGERGIGLSGGQKQRIGIARALIKKPKLFIFDEATSSLDAQSAELIAETVNQMRGKTTILFIAHNVPKNLKFDKHVSLNN